MTKHSWNKQDCGSVASSMCLCAERETTRKEVSSKVKSASKCVTFHNRCLDRERHEERERAQRERERESHTDMLRQRRQTHEQRQCRERGRERLCVCVFRGSVSRTCREREREERGSECVQRGCSEGKNRKEKKEGKRQANIFANREQNNKKRSRTRR